jgi:hypothetical protein
LQEVNLQKEEVKEAETQIITLSIPQTLYKQLQEHKEINRSQLFRNAALMELNKKKYKIHPLVYFVAVMGFAFSIVLIGISSTSYFEYPMNPFMKGVIALLGGILVVSTTFLFYKERRRLQVQH